MTPDDVRATSFSTGWRGYDSDEVDDFLSKVAHALSVVVAERDEARRRADELTAQAEERAEQEQLVQRTLLTAERTAQETREQAAADADRIRADARAEAERLGIETHERVRLEVEEAEAAAQRVRQAIEDLRAFRGSYTRTLREVIEEHLAMLDVPVMPELPGGLERLWEEGGPQVSAQPATGTASPPPSVLSDLRDLDDEDGPS